MQCNLKMVFLTNLVVRLKIEEISKHFPGKRNPFKNRAIIC